MTPLLGTALGLVLAALTALVVVVLAAFAVLIVLVSLLVLDRLLERNGVDRRRAVGTAWRRVRGPARTAGTSAPPPVPAERVAPRRTPFSTRLADRVATGRRPSADPEPPGAAQATAVPTTAVPVPDAPTEVLPVPPAEEPGDRDSAIQRLFAPLLDDRAGPPDTAPPPARPSRRRSDDE